MENFEAIGSVWFWILMSAILILHVAAVFVRRLKKNLLIVVSAINMLLHILLIGFMLFYRAEPGELFFALLLSTAVALFTTNIGARWKGDGKNDI